MLLKRKSLTNSISSGTINVALIRFLKKQDWSKLLFVPYSWIANDAYCSAVTPAMDENKLGCSCFVVYLSTSQQLSSVMLVSTQPFMHRFKICVGGSKITTSGLYGNWHAMRDTIQLNLLEIF